MESNQKKIAAGAGAVVIAGAIIGVMSGHSSKPVEVKKSITVSCKSAEASKDYETLDGLT